MPKAMILVFQILEVINEVFANTNYSTVMKIMTVFLLK